LDEIAVILGIPNDRIMAGYVTQPGIPALSVHSSLKKQYGIFVTEELHATAFVAGRGRIFTKTVAKGTRCRLLRETLAFVAQFRRVRLCNAIAPKANEGLIFERLMNHINTNMRKSGSNAQIIHDHGKDFMSLARITARASSSSKRRSVFDDVRMENLRL
jgi:hypothetical protein